jgi:hypothetical protein
MTSDPWSELISHYYLPPIDKHFSSDNILNAIRGTKWIVGIIETTKVIDEELSLYRNTYRLKKGKLIQCFYAAGKGEDLGWRMLQKEVGTWRLMVPKI